VRAVAVAAPVIDRLADRTGSPWTVVGATGATAYLERDRFVLALTGPDVPLMPNGIAVDQVPARWPAVGAHVRCGPGLVDLGERRQIRWSAADPPAWDPALTRARAQAREERPAVRTRGDAVLRSCRIRPTADPVTLTASLAASALRVTEQPDGYDGLLALLGSLPGCDAGGAAAATRVLLGRGPGLTPEGDDLLCAAAAAVARYAPEGERRDEWLAAVVPADARERSSDLSVTLLELAAAGAVTHPASVVLDVEERTWQPALRRLRGIGSSTGRAYALTIGAALVLLSD
jgi:hypothetical protein